MDKLSAMRAFVAIVDHGSLIAAGTALERSGPSMVRTLAALERELGVRLLRRSTRRMSLTEAGRSYLERCRRILADVDDAERALTSEQVEPRGQLRVTAPSLFGRLHVAPAVAAFVQKFDRVEVDLLLLDRVVNLVEEGLDVAVRIGPLPDSSLIAVPVGTVRRVVCAAPGLLKRCGRPEHPRDLATARCVRFRGIAPGASWHFRADGRDLPVDISAPFTCNEALACVEACVAGVGFGLFLSYQVEPHVREGRLRVLLEEFEPEPLPVSIVYSDVRMSARQRSLVDWLKAALRERPEIAARRAG